MKIGFVIPINGISGGLYVVYRHAHHLADQGHDVEILISNEAHGLEIHNYPNFKLKTRGLKGAIDSAERYDVLVGTWWETFSEMFFVKADHYLYFCQSDERRFYPSRASFEVPFVEQTYRDPGVGIVTEARWICDWLKRDFGMAAEYAPNGIDTSLFHPQVTPLAPRGEKLRVLIEGPGSQPFKRLDLAFRVAHRVPGIEVWLVSSDGVTQEHWKPDRVLTKLSLQEMPAVYASCDILLKLSTVEGFFGPPLEIMACGGTAVVSKATGWDEYIRHGENALAVEMDDENAAVEALTKLVRDRALRQRLSEEGLRTARAMDWTARCPLFEKAILALVSRELKSTLDAAHKAEHQVRSRLKELQSQLDAQEYRLKHLEDSLFNWKPFRTWKLLRERVRS